MAYDRLEPWGQDRADLRSAIIAMLIHNSNCKQGKTRPVSDFMAFREPRPPQTPKDMIAAMKAFAASQRALR